jgi:phage terminase large subunit-like protein
MAIGRALVAQDEQHVSYQMIVCDPRMAANVAVAQDPAGNLKPAKDKSTERIDGIVAAIMAIGRALVAQEEPQPEYSMFFV